MLEILISIFLITILAWIVTSSLHDFQKAPKDKRVYKNSFGRHFTHLFIGIAFLLVALVFLYTSLFPNEKYVSIISLFFGLLIIVAASISIFLYINYLLYQNVKSVTYDPKANILEIDNGYEKQSIVPHQVKKVNWHQIEYNWKRMIWNEYQFIAIELKSGERYIITSLLMNLLVLNPFFRDLSVKHFKSIIPNINNGA